MTNLMIRIVTLATCSIALIAAFPVTPVVAAGGSDLVAVRQTIAG